MKTTLISRMERKKNKKKEKYDGRYGEYSMNANTGVKTLL